MLRLTSNMGFTHDPAAGRESGPAAEALHQMLPGILAASAEANTIIRRGPGQQPEPITGELTIAIRRPAAGDDLADNSPAGAGLPITMARTAPVVPSQHRKLRTSRPRCS